MDTKFTIMSVNDTRLEKKENIRLALKDKYEEVFPQFVNGLNPDELTKFVEDNRWFRPRDWVPKLGELGVWASNVNVWKYIVDSNIDSLMVFEDDAILVPEFHERFENYFSQVPEDWDCFVLFTPWNQDQDFRIKVSEIGIAYEHHDGLPELLIGQEDIARAWQGYSCVGMMYSNAGAKRLLQRALDTGFYTPVDCWIYEQSVPKGPLNVYAPKPKKPALIEYDKDAPSVIQSVQLRVNMQIFA